MEPLRRTDLMRYTGVTDHLNASLQKSDIWRGHGPNRIWTVTVRLARS
jgi:hypothetical protein